MPGRTGVSTTRNWAESGEGITVQDGRYGPYVKCGSETRSLKSQDELATITLDEAVAKLKEPKKGRRRGGAASVIADLGAHPESGETVQVKTGRYGPYVTDGTVNADGTYRWGGVLVYDSSNSNLVYRGQIVEIAARVDELAATGPARLSPAYRMPLRPELIDRAGRDAHRQAADLVRAWKDWGVETGLLVVPAVNHYTIVFQLSEPEGVLFREVLRLLKQM